MSTIRVREWASGYFRAHFRAGLGGSPGALIGTASGEGGIEQLEVAPARFATAFGKDGTERHVDGIN